jgi:hypothetical protein
MNVCIPEMKFLNGILVEISGHKLESSHTRVFAWFSTRIFPFFKTLFTNRLELSCFEDVFVCSFLFLHWYGGVTVLLPGWIIWK